MPEGGCSDLPAHHSRKERQDILVWNATSSRPNTGHSGSWGAESKRRDWCTQQAEAHFNLPSARRNPYLTYRVLSGRYRTPHPCGYRRRLRAPWPLALYLTRMKMLDVVKPFLGSDDSETDQQQDAAACLHRTTGVNVTSTASPEQHAWMFTGATSFPVQGVLLPVTMLFERCRTALPRVNARMESYVLKICTVKLCACSTNS